MAAFSAASDTLTASTICSTSAGGKEIRDLKQTLETVRWRWRWPCGSGLRPPPLGAKLEYLKCP